MRLLAVSALRDDGKLAGDLFATAWLDDVDRVFLFGAAASAVAAWAAAKVRAQDDAYFDAAAAHLAGDDDEPPPRPVRDARLAKLIAVTREDPDLYAPLAATDRALEIDGPTIVMALPRGKAVDDEEVENADLWIAAEAEPVSVSRKERHIIGPGDFQADRRALLLTVTKRDIEVTWLDEAGPIEKAAPLELRGRSRMRMM